MDWGQFALDRWHEVSTWGAAVCATFGIGSGVGFVKLLNHWPPPYEDNVYGGAVFDTLQDLATNKRIGERRARNGATLPPVPKMDPIPNPVPAQAEKEKE